jgi:lysozyme family protein
MEVSMSKFAYRKAVNHVMLYEVGGFWDLSTPGTRSGTNPSACGYVNDPDDSGGETKYGVSKNNNPEVNVTNLTWYGAKDVFYEKYWLPGASDQIQNRIAVLHFDGCVNHGVGQASKFLQRAVGADDDGVVGPQTIELVNKANPFDVCNSICDQREQFYYNIVADNPSQEKYIDGWIRRIDEMREYTTNPYAIFSFADVINNIRAYFAGEIK